MKITDRTVTEVTRRLFAKMADKYGGDCTLNELRVMNAAYVYSFETGQCSPTVLAKSTNIPKSTVSRSLASLIDKGWLVDSQDEDDRRRRIIRLSEMAEERRSTDWDEVISWIVDNSEPCSVDECPSKED